METPTLDDIGTLLKMLLLALIRHHPEAVDVLESKGTQAILIEITVAEEDWGFIIGKDGKMVESIETLLSNWGHQKGRHYRLIMTKPTPKKLIRRKGYTANAVRELLANYSGKCTRRYVLEIIE